MDNLKKKCETNEEKEGIKHRAEEKQTRTNRSITEANEKTERDREAKRASEERAVEAEADEVKAVAENMWESHGISPVNVGGSYPIYYYKYMKYKLKYINALNKMTQ